jgi:transportin-3
MDSLFEVTEGLAHVVAAQPLDCIYENMGSFCKPIAKQLIALQRKGSAADEKDRRKVAGISNRDEHK